MATPQELIEYLAHNPVKFYAWMQDKGYVIKWVRLGSLGISYYLLAPDGEAIVPIQRDVLVKKPLNQVDHWAEGWIGYESLKAGQPPREWYDRTGIHNAFVGYVKAFNALPEWI